MNLLLAGAVTLFLAGCDTGSPPSDTTMVVSSDPELRAEVGRLLPDLLRRTGLELTEPVRVERRSRAELVRYLEWKLDEEMPPAEAARTARAYALLGLVSEDLDLRELFLSVYTEQVAGFYDPDSTALFVLDDMAAESMEPLLVHELVHALQDQASDLDSLTSKERGNDRQVAAQAAIEGHATLVMFEHMTRQLQGEEVDLSEIPDFAARVRPALEAMRTQYPALADAPAIFREAVLFPYLEGAGFVQRLWVESDARVVPLGARLPQSTEQILHVDRRDDEPTEVTVDVTGRPTVYSNGLGEFETSILLEELAGAGAGDAARGWDGDRFALVGEGAEDALVWVTVWDDAAARDHFVETLRPALGGLPRSAELEAVALDGRPGAILRVGEVGEVAVELVGGEDPAGG